MTTKGIDFKALARDLGIIAGFLGALATGITMFIGSTPSLAVSGNTDQDPITSIRDDVSAVERDLFLHKATDSVRWKYVEDHIVSIDGKLDKIAEKLAK